MDTFLESFNISENTSYELQDAIVEVFCYKRRSSPNKKAFQSSIKLYPIIFSYLSRNSNNHDAIRLFLSLKKEILIKNIDYLETLLQKNEMDTSIYNVFSEFVLEEGEPFLFFYPTILTMKEEFLNESTLVKIFDKYQEKVSVFLENALVHTDERIQRRAIRVLLETRSKFSNDFIATHFTKVLHALGTFHFEHALSFYSNFARRIDFKKFLPLVFSGKESPNHSFFFRYNEFLIIDRALIYLLKEDNFEAKKHPYLANLQTSRRCHLKWIAQKKGVGKNLLQVIAEYKIDREDAIMAVLYLLTEPELELEAKNTITIFPQEKIRETFTSENFLPPQGKEKEEIVRQKLIDIFGKSFFAEKE